MVAISAGLLASVMLLQPAAATFNWGAAKPFNNPNNNNNVCNDQQKGGFDWKNLPQGNFNKFGDFDFSGFSCKDSFSSRKGRRSLQARNGFQQKVIEGRCTADKASAPKISCGTDKNFSIKEMQVSVEFDTDIDFEYTMADGSSCKETQRCSAGGSTISNRQCGGAKSVTFKRPQQGKDCNIGIHKVDFDCEGPAPPPPPPPPSTKSSTTTQATTVSTKSSTTATKSSSTTTSPSTKATTTQSSSACTSCSKSTSTTTSSTSSSTSPTSSSLSTSTVPSPAPETSKTFSTLPPYANTTTSQSTESQTSSTEIPNTLTTTTSEVPNTLNTTAPPETVTTTSEQVTTELTFVTLTTCDVTLTQTTGDVTVTQTTQTLSTTTMTSTVTFCPKCGETVPTSPGLPPSPPSSTGEAPPPPPGTTSAESTTSAPSTLQTSTSAVPPPPPPPPADTPQSPCPETLPRCMNTWLSLANCASNSDASCMCPNSEFTKNVISCVTAWGASDTEIQAALSYFAGICAEFVPQNPGICTDVPTSITLIPTIAPTNPASPPTPTGTAPAPPADVNPQGPQGTKPAEVPCTTITLVNTVTATAGGEVQTTTQFITVPQVTFVTGSAEEATPTGAAADNNGAAASPAPAAPVGLVPMPQAAQAGPTTPASAASSTPVVVAGGSGGAAPSASNPIGNYSTTGPANPKISQFEGAAAAPAGVQKVVMGAAAGVLAVAAFAL